MIDGEDKIVERAVRGEASAFGLLYDHYQPKIYRFVMIKVGRREEAEDLTHQIFVKALENIARYEYQGLPFSSWLYRIARNQVIDHYRLRRNEVELEQADRETAVDPGSDPLEQKFELDRLLAALRKLPPEHQDVVLMRFVEDMSIREVAAALHKSDGAIKQIQSRAFKQLKNLLLT